jgi:hypothetical protein
MDDDEVIRTMAVAGKRGKGKKKVTGGGASSPPKSKKANSGGASSTPKSQKASGVPTARERAKAASKQNTGKFNVGTSWSHAMH